MTLGPIDFLALSFKGNNFKGEIVSGIQELVADGTIRIIDAVVVRKDAEGKVDAMELQELDGQNLSILSPLKAEVNSMITRTDIDMIAEKLENNSSAALLLWENLWAIKVKQAILDAGGEVVMQERIPHEVVEEALQDLAELSQTPA